MEKRLEEYVVTIPDFPEPGIMFRDVTGILQDADGFKLAVDQMCALVEDLDFDVIVGAEARGFIFGAAMAHKRQAELSHQNQSCRTTGKRSWGRLS